MTYRELVDKECEIVFGNGIIALRCVVTHDGDDCLTVRDVTGTHFGSKILVPYRAIKYVRVRDAKP